MILKPCRFHDGSQANGHDPGRGKHPGARGGPMDINIDQLTEPELLALNRKIVERLRFLQQMRAHAQMLDLTIGERVTFQPEGRPPLTGMVTRYNKKTVTVITDDGQHWNVAPHFLRKVEVTKPAATAKSTVVSLKGSC